MKHSNGGHTQYRVFEYQLSDGRLGQGSVSNFFALTADEDERSSVWVYTMQLTDFLGVTAVAFAQNGGGDLLYLSDEGSGHPVHILYSSSGYIDCVVASSFSEFIDKLHVDDYDDQ